MIVGMILRILIMSVDRDKILWGLKIWGIFVTLIYFYSFGFIVFLFDEFCISFEKRIWEIKQMMIGNLVVQEVIFRLFFFFWNCRKERLLVYRILLIILVWMRFFNKMRRNFLSFFFFCQRSVCFSRMIRRFVILFKNSYVGIMFML